MACDYGACTITVMGRNMGGFHPAKVACHGSALYSAVNLYSVANHTRPLVGLEHQFRCGAFDIAESLFACTHQGRGCSQVSVLGFSLGVALLALAV